MSYLQAIVIGLLQGITELFPISSLGHSVLLPAFLGWDNITGAQAAQESFYLAFLVGLHVATAIALLIYFRETWPRIISGFFRTVRRRKIETPDERLAWLLIISRSGVTMVAGLLIGLDHEDAARFSFLLATPIIFAAGVYKIPDLLGPNGDGVRGQVVVGSVCAGLAAYAAVRFLMRWFETRTLTPFAIYSVVIGTIALIRFA
jgi:undecaprenyl pyrophosphate phosphatase UppP